MGSDFILFAGTANRPLAEAVAGRLGLELGRCTVERFPDGEVSVRLEETVLRKGVFVLQPTSPPVDGNLVELLSFADAARRAAADRITAIIPYFGYARGDKRHGRRESVAARMVADLLQAVGVAHVITMDLHAAQIEGFFSVPVENLTAVEPLAAAAAGRLGPNAVVAAPDEGRVRTARRYAERLDLPLVVLHKRRESGSRTGVTRIVGEVEGRQCLVVDDMITTGGTITATVDALLEAGALPDILIAATHGLMVGDAKARLDRDEIAGILVTDSVPPPHPDWPRLRVLSAAPLLADAIREFVGNGSPGALGGR